MNNYIAVPAVPSSTQLRGRRESTSAYVPAVPMGLAPQRPAMQVPSPPVVVTSYPTPPPPIHHIPQVAPPPPPPPPPPAPPPAPVQFSRPAYVELPWYSSPDTPFPARRRRRPFLKDVGASTKNAPKVPVTPVDLHVQEPIIPISQPNVSELPTPETTQPSSEIGSANPSTPTSTAPPSTSTAVAHKLAPALPLTPPAVPIIKPKVPKAPKPVEAKEAHVEPPSSTPSSETSVKTVPTLPAAVVPAVPKSWAELVKTTPGKDTENTRVAVIQPNGTSNGKVGSIPQILSDFQIRPTGSFTIPFLEPRGLVNTGNMCFMNAVLQMLVFCGPFYYFLDRVGKEAAHNFKSETPLIDAMIMFMREFRVTPITVKQDLEALGEPFVPEFLYEVIHNTKNFTHMRRGHQQDAEEFLGFLLDGLHEEAVKMMKKSDGNGASSVSGDSSMDDTDESGWMEVGHKQKAATTRTTEISESPITKIFGGKLRSVFQVPGLKPSVTTEPYTPLQLDIQAPEVRSVVDALKHLTTPEKIQGDFKSPKGPNVVAKKQVFIQTLPPVLILHLKRFQYDNTGGTQKIWKKIGYPLELQIPPEAMSPTQRAGPSAKYRLIGVVYHHGKSASGGHYTVDVLRQDAKNWIRLDDTVIRRVRSEEVAVDVKDLGSQNTNDGEENDGWVNGWEEVTANGSGTTNKGEGARYIGKDSKVAYILFYQKL